MNTRAIIIMLFAAFVCTNADASIKGCVNKPLKNRPTDSELKILLENHEKWINEYKLNEPNSWASQTANGVAKILTDPRRANLSEMDLTGIKLSNAKLIGAKFDWSNLDKAIIVNSDLSKSIMKCAKLKGASIQNSSFDDAILEKADLSNAKIESSIFSNANLVRTSFESADINKSVFENSTLSYANMTYAIASHSRFVNSKFKNTKVDFADFSGSIWELDSGALPPSYSAARIFNLSKLKYTDSPASLIELREEFRKAGLVGPERDITFTLNSTKNTILRASGFFGALESGFNYFLFDLTSEYGRQPGRPLLLLGWLILLFSIPYYVAIITHSSDGIWKVWNKDRVRDDIGGEPEKLFTRGYKAIFLSLYFSITSAFRMGWKDLNVGTWISNMQGHDYSLQGTGWVRSLAGAQSLLSVYLLALWALTYFGNPFG